MKPASAELRATLISRLISAGCVFAAEEAEDLLLGASSEEEVWQWLERRERGEPLAWVVGATTFCGVRLCVRPGVYIPRPQTEPLALAASELLPDRGRAVDLGTGSGAIAAVMSSRRPNACVIGVDCDQLSVRCARENEVRALEGTLFEPLPRAWKGRVDVAVGCLPYVPRAEIPYLPRDVRDYEPLQALEGGEDGLEVLRRAVTEAALWLSPRGHLLLELGADQNRLLGPWLAQSGFEVPRWLVDEDKELRGVVAQRRI